MTSEDEHDRIHQELTNPYLTRAQVEELAERHKVLTAGDTYHASPIALKLPNIKAPLPWTGTKVKMLPFLVRILKAECPNATTYIDPVAGSSSIPYHLRLHGIIKRSITNDITYMSYCMQRAFLCGDMSPWVHPDECPPVEGYLSKVHPWGKHFDEDTCATIDGICAANKDSPLALLSAGIALMRTCTFRGMSFLASDARKVTPEVWSANFMQTYERLRDEFKAAPGEGASRHGDCIEFTESLPDGAGDFIAPDFADPWEGQGVAAQYMLPFEIGQITAQQDHHHPGLWTTENIVERLQYFASVAVRKAKLVAICSQSSNYPPPEDLPRIFAEVGLQTRRVYTLDRLSTFKSAASPARILREYFVLLEGQC